MKTIQEAAEFLRQHDNYLILTHRRPDGDTIGSAAALCMGLQAMGKQAELFPNSQFGGNFSALTWGLTGSGDPAGKTVISVDLASESLLPYNTPGMAGKIVFALDHHGSNTHFAAQDLVVPTAAACGEIVLDVLDELGVDLDKGMAEALYVAISTDTGCFRFSNVTPATYRAAARCLEAGADTAYWNQLLFLTKSKARLQVEAYLAQHVEFFADGRIALCLLPQSVVNELGATEDDLDNVSDYARSISGVEFGALLRDVSDGAKISARCYEPWDASAVCALMGGGGHPAAAGATVPGSLEDGRMALLKALRQFGAEV